MSPGSDLPLAARNLLETCAGLSPGQSLLIVTEEPGCGMYGAELAGDLAQAARDMALSVTLEALPFSPDEIEMPAGLLARMQAHDQTVFLHRLGDQLRFSAAMSKAKPIVCYALDSEMLASGFGQASHDAMVALKNLVNQALASAEEIRITCPLGTDVAGTGAAFPETGADTSVIRFPLSVFTPVPASGFRGRIAQAGFLVGTGSHYYAPYGIALKETLHVLFDGTRITGFEGDPDDVAAAEAHYRHVGETLGIDPWYVHSWHAGIHPGCAFPEPAGDNLERWSGGAFGNPRLLHFHTCGAYPPGEISLNIVDPTVTTDDTALWQDGILYPDRLAGGKALLERFDGLRQLFEKPAREIGLGAAGRLAFAG